MTFSQMSERFMLKPQVSESFTDNQQLVTVSLTWISISVSFASGSLGFCLGPTSK